VRGNYITTFLTAALCVATSLAAQLPDAPRAHLDRTEKAALAASAVGMSLDGLSTERCLGTPPCTEAIMPRFVVSNRNRLAVLESAGWVAEVLTVRRYGARHRRAMVAALFGQAAVESALAANNFRLVSEAKRMQR
jgi:hypothetical protein